MSSRNLIHHEPSRQFADNLTLATKPLPATPLDSSLLSPYNRSRANSTSLSPAYNFGSTEGESASDYSNYQPSEYSEVEDEFFGVDFDAGVPRIDSLPSNLDPAGYQPTDFSLPLPVLPRSDSSDSLSASIYPLSPKHSSNTSSPRSETDDIKTTATILQHELTADLENFSFAHPLSVSIHLPASQLTPDHSGSSRSSAEGLEPGSMASPHVTISQWADGYIPRNAFVQSQPDAPYQEMGSSAIDYGYASQRTAPKAPSNALRDEEGIWTSNHTTGQAGLDPDSRKLISEFEIPSLRQQEIQRRIDSKNNEVQEWRSGARGTVHPNDERPQSIYTEENNIQPVDDAASIRDNRLLDDQVYYNLKNAPATEADLTLMSRPRQFNDPPSLPYMTSTAFQPSTANEAIQKFNGNADTFSITSRAATWGTRRHSEPSLQDYESVADGSFLKKLSINRGKDGDQHNNSIFEQGLRGLANMVRKRSVTTSHGIKRPRSSQNIETTPTDLVPSQNNGCLAPPTRAGSFGRKPSPSLNTAIGAMTAPLAAVRGTHARSGSISAMSTSPKSPLLGGLTSMMRRARSRSDLTAKDNASQTGLVGLWRGQGGPPVPNLASSSHEAAESKRQQMDNQDLEEDDDDDEEQGDDNDMRADPGQMEPIIPNYEGFKAHVRRLNPDMNPRYSWLVSRIAHQQEIRYKNLLDLRVKHLQATRNGSCTAGPHCMAFGGNATLLDAKGKVRDLDRNTAGGLQLVTDFSDDSNPGEGALTNETFPKGVPMPPTKNLPAEFECQLCFKSKKFQKPSDWTKHVHEDVQPFTCTYDKCKEPKSFKRKADWVRHENERHRHLEWWICQMDDCRHPCYRKDNFLQHLVREHKLPEPKQKTKAAIKKARTTEPAWIMLEKCHHETQHKPQDEPCKFCGKAFTTWKKLTVHLAKHMEYISLPVLNLVKQKDVYADTIISPVEQNLTPVTPASRTKFEPSSPFNLHSISPHAPVVPQFSSSFTQPVFYPTSSAPAPYGMQAPISQDATYDHNALYSDAFGINQTNQTRPYGVIDGGLNNAGMGNIQQSRSFGSMDSNYSQQPKMEPRMYGSAETNFSHIPQTQNYNHVPATDFTMRQPFVTTAPPNASYQASGMLGISDASFFTGGLTHTSSPNYQQVPMSRSHGSGSSYGGHGNPENLQYYGPQ